MKLPRILAATSLLVVSLSSLAASEALLLRQGDRLALCGDSITEQKQYTVMIETYVRACRPDLAIAVIQVGQQGENTQRFLERLDYAALSWKPTVATTCYGMNDGTGGVWNDGVGTTYRANLEKIAAIFTAAGVRVVLGSPGVVDITTLKREVPTPVQVNDNLARVGVIAGEIAKAGGYGFADVHTAMATGMQGAKAAYGSDYHVAGTDGVHPWANGHLCMAYGFLKGFGFSGDLATISLTWPSTASATAGHTVRSTSDGTLELSSTRYPYCFQPPVAGAKPDPACAATMLPFLPFQQDLNRFVLQVAKLPSAKAEVTWGSSSKVFTREQLAAGVNLAAEFLDNPFLAPFLKVQEAVHAKQDNETLLARDLLPSLKSYDRWPAFRTNPEVLAAVAALRSELAKALDSQQAPTQATVVPVTHQIRIRPLP